MLEIDVSSHEYIAGIAAAIITWIVCAISMRMLQYASLLLIALVVIGAAALPFYSLHTHSISTIQELLSLSIVFGILASVLCMIFLPFTGLSWPQPKRDESE